MGKGPSTTPKIDDGVWLANLFNFKNFQNLDHDRESGTSLGVTHKIAHRREADLCTVPPPSQWNPTRRPPGCHPRGPARPAASTTPTRPRPPGRARRAGVARNPGPPEASVCGRWTLVRPRTMGGRKCGMGTFVVRSSSLQQGLGSV